ncbi:MAG TPA: winged helix-turn-helix domain-containing protein [Anaerolineae bacterium]|nr:winged helix-turn-helix domain-containing protein [Anaerolineae bacterium]
MTNEVPLTTAYRETEVRQIFRRVKAGDSCLIVAASGMAKSNLFRHLLRREVREQFLGPAWQSYLFASIDTHALPKVDEANLYELIVRKLLEDGRSRGVLGDDLAPQTQHYSGQLGLLLSSNEPSLIQRTFLSAMELLATHPDLHFVILFDQFDEVYPHLQVRCLATLRHLRDSLKYRLSYLVFTREELSRLSDGQDSEEFNELLSPGLLWLGPYQLDDAWTLLRRIAARYGDEVDAAIGDRLIALTHGHPGLLKAAYQAVGDGRVRLSGADHAAQLLDDPDVKTECVKLWKSVSPEEQAVLAQLTEGAVLPSLAGEDFERLKRKHLVRSAGARPEIFCPLFAAFVARRPGKPDAKLVEAAGAKSGAGLRIDAGAAWLGKREIQLSPSEFKLLEFLCQRQGIVCTRDDIIQHVYPDEHSNPDSGIADNRVDTLVSRLRARIKSVGGDPNLIATVWGRGFRFAADTSDTD